MARLLIPNDFNSQIKLLLNIKEKNGKDDASSPLTAFLIQQGILLDDDVTAGDTALTHETSRALLSKQSENFRQLRDNYFKPVWSHLTGGVQFLKSFYKGNTKELGNWGITITDSGKINYPPAFADRLVVFDAFINKNNGYAAGASPLQAYIIQQGIDLAKDAGFATQAGDNNNSFTAAAQQSENETELRNKLWSPVLEHIKAIGNYLMKLYSNNAKALGAWGFVVDDSVQKPKLRTSKIKIGEKITTNGVLIGSTLTNAGETDIHVYKGKTTTGTPAIIHKGEQLGMQKGFSSTTVVNPSLIQEAKFTVMVVN